MKALAWILTAAIAATAPATASDSSAFGQSFSFANIDGGTHQFDDWQGRPILLVNTASQCGFTDQYNGLQDLYDQYRDAGLVVLAVPSDDFNQELDTAAEVKEFCELNYATDLPMTDIAGVRGPGAHPLYAWIRKASGFQPAWNFNKVLIAPDGQVVATFGATVRPTASRITRRIEELL